MESSGNILYLVIALISGFFIAWIIIKLISEKDKGLSLKEIESNYIPKDLYENEKKNLAIKESEILELNRSLARTEEHSKNLTEKLEVQKSDMEDLHNIFKTEFKNLSNELLEEKGKKFTELNEKNIGDILKPLKEKISDFEKKVDDTFKEETRERISLKKELEQIVKLNQQVSEDTNRLTGALKGDKKLQGNWGELQLELILEKAGLEKDIHYRKQETLLDAGGNVFRPDYIINLPEDRNLIIDSKVSLVAYENYFNSENDNDKASFLKEHLKNIMNHISDLSSKNYPKLYGINPPDYVIMFVPIEPALHSVLKENTEMIERALEKNVLPVSTSTLLATMKTISFIWKQERQRKNVIEIANESGALYDKFHGFINDLVTLGNKIDDSKENYSSAMNKLFESKKKGDTIIGRIERIKKLGAETNKSLPENILRRLEEIEDPDSDLITQQD
ncbi:MAG TPA: DNA recombination protein RmuC [Ignavibacteria bacterium]|nr:DNA recombination protein RmuC [Ignavibacteria bacterium]HRA99143.1 DNA recombination protein RmuC [Ignavibacteria bacterium]